MIRIEWTIEGKGAGQGYAEDADGAAVCLAAGVREAFADLGAQALSDVLLSAVAPLRMAIVTDGALALKNEGEWQSQAGPILVSMSLL